MAISWSSIVASINTTTLDGSTAAPYTVLPGTSAVGTSGTDPETLLAADVATRFPNYDWEPGETLTPPSGDAPAGFSMNPTYDAFSTWTSEWQAYMLDLWRNQKQGQSDQNSSIKLTDSSGNAHYVIRSLESPKVFDLDTLQKRDFASMSLEDQKNIAADSNFQKYVADTLGLIPSSTVSLSFFSDAIRAKIKEMTDKFSPNTTNFPSDWSKVVPIFKQELANLLERVDSNFDYTNSSSVVSGIFNQNDVLNKIGELTTRYNRLLEFAKGIAQENKTNTANTLYVAPSSTDNGAAMLRGFNIFLAQEKRIMELDNQRLKIASDGFLNGKALDAPTLVFLFQQYTMLTTEAINSAQAEEANQYNDLLKFYQAMQALVNEIVKSFNPKEASEKKNLMAAFGSSVSEGDTKSTKIASTKFLEKASDSQKDLFYGFKTTLLTLIGQNGGGTHPLEALNSIPRPKQEFVDSKTGNLKTYYRDGWNAFATQLGDTVTQLNQQSQILQNKINSSEKEKNRYFEQANSALSKLYDVMNNVARAI